jgi:hypothetical protein
LNSGIAVLQSGIIVAGGIGVSLMDSLISLVISPADLKRAVWLRSGGGLANCFGFDTNRVQSC